MGFSMLTLYFLYKLVELGGLVSLSGLVGKLVDSGEGFCEETVSFLFGRIIF